MGDRQIAVIGLRHTDPEQRTVVDELLTNVRRVIAEEIPDVRVLSDAAAWQLGAKAVQNTTAVGMDESADQRARMRLGELELPVSEDDRS